MISYINTVYKFYVESDNSENTNIFEVELIKDKYYKFKTTGGEYIEGFINDVIKTANNKVVIINLHSGDRITQTQISSDLISYFELNLESNEGV